jgi:hypothetical protein
MKKLMPVAAVLFLSLNLSAQYKKAGFFEKEGRTYELASQVYMMGKGNGNPIGYKVAFGRDKEGKNLFKSWDLQFIPSHQYSYTTVNENETSITVTGKSKSIFVYGLNWGYHLLKNEAENNPRVQPFIGAGINVLLAGGPKSESYSPEPVGIPKRNTSVQSVSVGINGGLGCIVNFTPKWALKVQGGYSHQINMSTDNWSDEVKPFYVFNSHKYVSLGLRLRIVKD